MTKKKYLIKVSKNSNNNPLLWFDVVNLPGCFTYGTSLETSIDTIKTSIDNFLSLKENTYFPIEKINTDKILSDTLTGSYFFLLR